MKEWLIQLNFMMSLVIILAYNIFHRPAFKDNVPTDTPEIIADVLKPAIIGIFSGVFVYGIESYISYIAWYNSSLDFNIFADASIFNGMLIAFLLPGILTSIPLLYFQSLLWEKRKWKIYLGRLTLFLGAACLAFSLM